MTIIEYPNCYLQLLNDQEFWIFSIVFLHWIFYIYAVVVIKSSFNSIKPSCDQLISEKILTLSPHI